VADKCADLLDALVPADDESEDPTASPGFFAEQSVGLVGDALSLTDPQFVTTVRDVVGIYLRSPENALVLAAIGRRHRPEGQ
jgi:hypothetical protein